LGLLGWLTTARLVRAHVLHLREAEFILAARVLGVGEWTMMWRHLLPHILPTVLCLFALQTPQFILEEAFLSFMGLGVQAPRPSLGSLIAEGSRHMSIFPWELWFPAATLALMLASLQIFGKTLEKRWSISE
jgi:oligopeptide transport system permease protein